MDKDYTASYSSFLKSALLIQQKYQNGKNFRVLFTEFSVLPDIFWANLIISISTYLILLFCYAMIFTEARISLSAEFDRDVSVIKQEP